MKVSHTITGNIANHAKPIWYKGSKWSIKRLKYLAEINKESLPENTSPDLEIRYIDISNVTAEGEITAIQEFTFDNAPSRARRIPKNSDTIISTVRTYLKAIAYLKEAENNLIVSTGFAVLHPGKNLTPKFLYYAVRSATFIHSIMRYSKGVSYPAITSTELGELPIAYPDLKTQQQIVKYLDRRISQLESITRKQNRAIELLQEKRIALISHAVTKGLDPNAKMKDSGVEWIGNVPEHWALVRIKYLAGNCSIPVQTGPFGAQLHASDYVDDGVPLILIRNVDNGKINDQDIPYISEDDANRLSMYRLEIGDIVFSRVGSLGRAAQVTEKENGWLISGQMLRLRLQDRRIKTPFLVYLFQSDTSENYVSYESVGSTRESLNTAILSNMVIPIPPLSEQKQIVHYLDQETAKIDQLIDEINKQIELLNEYKTSLISHAVTGKINVREVT